MVTITLNERDEKEVEITPDYCFGRAAQLLCETFAHGPQGVEMAREWRELGNSIAIHG